MMKKSGNLFILVGVLLFGYVAYEQIYAIVLERKIIAETVEISQSLQEVVNEKRGGVDAGLPNSGKEPISIPKPLELSIPSIDLNVKVVEGTSKDKLRVAVGHLEGTGGLGNIDENFVILGHRSHITGKFFNRLDELQIGEFINIKGNANYTYQIIDKKIIRPTQLEILEPIKNKSIVTLITCHPKYSSKQRLVVIAERVHLD
jgi:sortase A